MSNSKLATKFIKAADCNHYGKRTAEIDKMIVHHAAGKLTAERLAQMFADPKRGASATYCIGNDGEIVQCLDESIAPGTSGSYEADNRAVTVEVANCENGGQWRISAAAMKSLIRLCADVAKRNKKIGTLVRGKNLCWHQMYAATACPGPYLISKMGYVADEANKLNKPFEGELAGNDKPRGADQLVLYFKGLTGNGRTGTNRWGYEVQIDKNGVVLENPHYSGNTVIPAGGKVLSGHGIAGEWIYKNIKKGYVVWFSGGKTHVGKGIHRSVDSVNGTRGAEQLVVYNAGKNANTNKWGYEVAIDKNGKAICAPIYGVGKMAILEGGFVLSGHNTAGKWIADNIKKGSTVSFDGKIVTIK